MPAMLLVQHLTNEPYKNHSGALGYPFYARFPWVEKHFLTDKYINHLLNKVYLKRFLLSSLNYRNHRTMYVSRVKPKFNACVGILGLSLFLIGM